MQVRRAALNRRLEFETPTASISTCLVLRISPNHHKKMTHEEIERYSAMEADRNRMRKLLEFQDIQIANQAETLTEMNRQIKMRKENNFGLHRRNVRLAKALEDIAAHDGPGFPHGTCAKIARRALDSQNVQAMASEGLPSASCSLPNNPRTPNE